MEAEIEFTGMIDAFGMKLVKKLSYICGRGGRDLVGYHLEARERAGAKRSHDRNVSGVAPACHQDATDARLVVAGIECVPSLAEINFEPSAEVHRRIFRRNA